MKELSAAAIGQYVDSVIDGVNVTQVEVDGRTGAALRGNKVLIKWGPDSPPGSFSRQKFLVRAVKWGKRKLEKKSVRVEERKEWTRIIINGYSVYDVEGKEEVAKIMAQIERDVRPIVDHFNIRYSVMKESVAEGSLGYNRGAGDVISLNVRQKADTSQFRKYSAIMATMIHELAHVRHMNHGRQFQEFEIELMNWARTNGIYRPF
jgi:hypothetical protein